MSGVISGRAHGEFTIRNDEGSWRASVWSTMETDPRPEEGPPLPHLDSEYVVWGRGQGGHEGLLLFARMMPAPEVPAGAWRAG